MRRFIRRAPANLIGEFGALMKELAEVSSGQVWLEMDDYVWDFDYVDGSEETLSRKTLDELKESISYGEEKSETT